MEKWRGTQVCDNSRKNKMKYNWEVKNLELLSVYAKDFIQIVKNPRIIAFDGEMGIGKTTFINALLKELGVSTFDGSPTFSIINEYQIKNSIKAYHIDCYRIKNQNEILELGLDELIEEPHYFFMEWAEKIATIFPKEVIWVYIRKNENSTTREISFEI